jgi:hypothetical protein
VGKITETGRAESFRVAAVRSVPFGVNPAVVGLVDIDAYDAWF